VVQLLQSMQDINAYVLLVGSKNRILGICRSDETVPLWDLLQDLNPSGHKYAFVFRKRGNLISFYETLPDLLRSKMLAQTLVTEVSFVKDGFVETMQRKRGVTLFSRLRFGCGMFTGGAWALFYN